MRTRNAATTGACAAVLMCLLLNTANPAHAETRQGWTQSERELWWNSPQGSRIIPYDWFLNLERTDTPDLFSAPAHLAEYGFVPSTTNAVNPDGLPIGLAKERDRSNAAVWLGITCAACHTGALRYHDASIPIDGAGSMVDVERFDRDLSAAVTATAADDARFKRFADRLGTPPEALAALHTQLNQVATTRAAYTAINAPPHDPGPGRIDLHGQVMNALTATALGQPGNAQPPDQPIRPPFVWKGSGPIGIGPLLRAIESALGVYGVVDVTRPPISPAGDTGYPSSVSVVPLQMLEALLHTLQPPAWPANVLPPIDAALARRGEAVFAGACASCHAGRAENVGAAAQDSGDEAASRVIATGMLEGRPIAIFAGPVFGPRAAASAIIGHIVTGVAMQLPKARLQAGLQALRSGVAPVSDSARSASSLAGVWAGAPYLHNGSVPNLQQLLTPPAQRVTRFALGGQDFDPVAVGFPADASGPNTVLDTRLPGNDNAGHGYGTTLSEADKAALIEYLKTL